MPVIAPICPQCGGETAPDDQFCPHCGYFLPWAEEAEPGDDTPVVPEPDATEEAGTDPGAPSPLPPVLCPRCQEPNDPHRAFCSVCGHQLQDAEPPEETRPKERRRIPRSLLVAAGVLAGLVVVVLIVLAVLPDGDGVGSQATELPGTSSPETTTQTEQPSASSAEPTAIDSASITASASSRLDPVPDQGLTYDAGNTLDGDPTTAWNDGAPGDGIGEQLTYRFSAPVELTRIDLVNGYAKSPSLFEENGRLHDVSVITDAGTTEFELVDTRSPQVLDGPFGVTSSVTLRVLSVYPGSKYQDLALTDIAFTGRPAG